MGSAHRMETGLTPRRWDDLAGGYAHETRDALGALMTYDSLPAGGRLILWHGEPGTGKTNALRALAHQWGDWCELDYITDPAQFISGNMSYLLDVLSGSDTERSRLLVLEDSGELMATDAKEQSGQGLSRLLNLSDGLLVSSTNALILITTNEPLGRLHPAVHRPGRCVLPRSSSWHSTSTKRVSGWRAHGSEESGQPARRRWRSSTRSRQGRSREARARSAGRVRLRWILARGHVGQSIFEQWPLVRRGDLFPTQVFALTEANSGFPNCRRIPANGRRRDVQGLRLNANPVERQSVGVPAGTDRRVAARRRSAAA